MGIALETQTPRAFVGFLAGIVGFVGFLLGVERPGQKLIRLRRRLHPREKHAPGVLFWTPNGLQERPFGNPFSVSL